MQLTLDGWKDLSVDTIVGTLMGFSITLVAIFLEHTFSVKREERREERKRKEEAISQVYSPLVFMLDKTRGLFARILATHEALKKASETEAKEQITAAFILNYLTTRYATAHSKVLENLLTHKSGLIDSKEFYFDLLIFHSYLSTITSFLNMILLRYAKAPTKLSRYFSSLEPIIRELELAIEKMKNYSLAKVSRQMVKYEQFFTEQKFLEVEDYVDQVSKEITGGKVSDWQDLLKRLKIEI